MQHFYIKQNITMDNNNIKYKNKYRIPSARLPHWDYASNAVYFVTVCTANRECFFGDIVNGKMILSEIGEIAHNYWLEIPNHFKFVKLGEFIIMPNHLHGIIIINKNDDGLNENYNGSCMPKLNISIKWKSGTLGVIINQYKRICTINARKISPNFVWQARFYEHIIRNEKSYLQISEYITYNPINWKDDELYDK